MIRTANLTWSVSRKAGGLFESVRRLVQSLERTQVEVCVFGVRDEFTDSDLEAWKPVRVLAFKPTWPESFGYSPGFLEELATFEPDVTHTHGIWVYPSVATNLYGTRTGRPYMISAHGMLDPWAVRNSRWKKVIAHWLYEGTHLRSARCLRALCEPEARAIRQLGLTNDIAVIPNGIDPRPQTSPGPAPWKHIIEDGKKVLLFLSRIHPKKGLMNLLRAWAAVQNSSRADSRAAEWVLAIAGWDQAGHETELKRLATDLGISWTDLRTTPQTSPSQSPATEPSPTTNAHESPVPGPQSLVNSHRSMVHGPQSSVLGPQSSLPGPWSVVFLGPQFDGAKSACYEHCDAFILPSFSEGVPMVVLEAWTHSKPVVITPQCNLPQAFSRGAAVRIEPTPEGIREGLNQLMGMTQADRANIGARGHALAAGEFSWPRLAGQMKETYEWMLGGGPRPACLAAF